MKHLKCMVGLFAFASLTVLNFAQSEKNYLLGSMASSSSSNPSTSTSGSTSSSSSSSSTTRNPCCKEGLFQSECNKERTKLTMDLDCRIIHIIYYSASGTAQTEVWKFGELVSSVSGEFKAKAAYSEIKEEGGIIKNAPVVMCPTSGECNNCEEYRPECKP